MIVSVFGKDRIVPGKQSITTETRGDNKDRGEDLTWAFHWVSPFVFNGCVGASDRKLLIVLIHREAADSTEGIQDLR
jgi:hypothetical protein